MRSRLFFRSLRAEKILPLSLANGMPRSSKAKAHSREQNMCVRACDCQSAKGNACGCVTGFEREEAREHRTHNARQSKGMEGYQLAGTLDDAGGASLG